MAETPLSPDSAPGENAALDATAIPSDAVSASADGEGSGASAAGDAEAPASPSLDSGLSADEALASPPDGEALTEAEAETTAPWSPPAPPESPEPGATTPAAATPAAATIEPPLPVEAPLSVEPAAPLPGIATTIAVPPLATAAGSSGEGGEWELLVGKLNAWLGSGELTRQWQRIRGPLKGVALLIAVVLALRLYATVVGSIDRLPVVSGLLELTGLIAVGRFGLTKLVRSEEREQVLAHWNQRWQAFLGQD